MLLGCCRCSSFSLSLTAKKELAQRGTTWPAFCDVDFLIELNERLYFIDLMLISTIICYQVLISVVLHVSLYVTGADGAGVFISGGTDLLQHIYVCRCYQVCMCISVCVFVFHQGCGREYAQSVMPVPPAPFRHLRHAHHCINDCSVAATATTAVQEYGRGRHQ